MKKKDDDNKAYFLTCSTGPAISAGNMRIENGVPIHRYRKELIKTGQFCKASDGIAFEVTSQTLDHWAATFAQYIAAGNKVPIPLTHDFSGNPENNAGWIVDMFREENSLVAILDLVGEDGPTLALTSDVSIFSPPSLVDGKGNKYIRPITHVALCTDPVIPGLKGFETIAASMKSLNDSKEINSMENMKKIATVLGMKIEELGEDVTKAGEAIVLSIKGKLEALATATHQVTDVTKEKETLALSMQPRAVDPLLITLAKENRVTKLAALVASAKITPAVKDKLTALYATDEVLKLSLSKGGDNFDNLALAIAENDPVKLGEQTAAQALILSKNKGEEKNALTAEIDNRVEAQKKR